VRCLKPARRGARETRQSQQGGLTVSKPSVIQRMCVLAAIGAAVIQAPFAFAQSAADKQQSMDAMKKMDMNKDGMVSKDEYMKFYEAKFETMDKNKDKMVTQEEWFSAQFRSDGG
jgi:carbamoylphosphate synthase large subunit